MLLPFIILLLGLFGIWYFADVIVVRSIKVARALNISEGFIGLTFLSIGTSFPELSTTIVSSINVLQGKNASSLALSTNIGSDLVQLTLIMGIVALLSTVYTTKKILYRDYIMMVGSHVLVFVLALSGYINRTEGFLLLFIYGMYLFALARKETIIQKRKEKDHIWLHSLIVIVSLAALLFCGKLVVDNSLFLSDYFHISQTFFGALIIGVASALPELTTALHGMRQKSQGISLGVLVGSNITNPLMNIGLGALISGYTVSKEILFVDLPYMIGVSIICFFFFKRKMTITKGEAITLILFYFGYALLKFRLLSTAFG